MKTYPVLFLKVIFMLHFELALQKQFMELRTISHTEEGYVTSKLEYVLHDSFATWEEAKILCKPYKFEIIDETDNGLATFDNGRYEVLNAFAETVSNSDFDLGHIWIGVKRDETGDLKWLGTKTKLVPSVLERVLPKSPEKNGGNCLAFQREDHANYSLVELDCYVQRQFLCQRPAYHATKWVRIFNSVYAAFHDQVTFEEAVLQCHKQNNAHLATFRNQKETQVVIKKMYSSRPKIDRAWIGGRYDNDLKEIRFIATNDVIPTVSNNVTGFPSWDQGWTGLHTKDYNCLYLAMKQSNFEILYVNKCDKRMPYICERFLDNANFTDQKIVKDTVYFLFHRKFSWSKAKVHCDSINGILAKITADNIKSVLAMMGEGILSETHLWIGAKYNDADHKFYWIKDNSMVPPEADNQNYPPWDFEGSLHQQWRRRCLNMDRAHHDVPLFYGADCDHLQPFICEKAANKVTGHEIDTFYPVSHKFKPMQMWGP